MNRKNEKLNNCKNHSLAEQLNIALASTSTIVSNFNEAISKKSIKQQTENSYLSEDKSL